VFVDAALCGEPVKVVRIEAAEGLGVMTHAADPSRLLALCTAVYRRSPEVWLVTATGADFEFREGLSSIGRENAHYAFADVQSLIRRQTHQQAASGVATIAFLRHEE
jgi:Ni,Fe-hydrogenase maturation factor